MTKQTRTTNTFATAGRTLEEAFFSQQDQALVDKLRDLRKMAETKEALAAVSGIHDAAVLEKLVNLGIKPEIVAALAVVPLVEIAWADGSVDENEVAAVLSAASSHGIAADSVEYALIERWLEHKPEPALLEAWKHYVQGFCASLSPTQRQQFKTEFLRRARTIAEASRSLLGLGRAISRPEQALLTQLEQSFG
jgi:hypothetical protein